MFKLSQLAELKTVFPEGGDLKHEELLKGIQKATLIKVATDLIGKNLFSGEKVDNVSALENWFSEGNKVFADDMLSRINAYKKKSGKSLTIVYNISCLKILQYGLELEEQGLLDQKSKERSEIDLFLAMLALNQNEDYHQTKDKAKIKALFSESLVPAAMMLNYSFATQDITNFHFEDYNGCQVIKFLLLFNFLEQSEEGRDLIKRFCIFFNLKNWQEYLKAVFPLILAWTEREHGGALDMILIKDESYDHSYDFLKKLALGDYIKIEDYDYIKIREKPLVQLDEVTFRIIHPLFVSDKIYKGMFFLLKQLNEEGTKLIGNFRSWFTTNFSESYCFTELIKYSFHNSDALFFDDELRVSGVVGPPDGYVRQENDVFLFENKDILIGAAIKGSYNFEDLIAELKKKLIIEGTRGVGIGQVVNNIRKLLTGENKFDGGFISDQSNIYPIIILHDPMFDAPGLNYIMNAFFQEELDRLRNEGINVDRVEALCLVNIDALIQASPILNSGKVTLKEVLKDYYTNLIIDQPKGKNYDKLESLYQNAMPPFYHYMKNYLIQKIGENWRSQDLMALLLKKSKID